MKKIVIASQNGTNPKFKKWAKEAVVELLQMFPEYKNSFQIEFRDDAHAAHKEITQEEYDRLPDDAQKLLFVKTSGGKWLVPYESMEWYITQAKKANLRRGEDALDLRVLSALNQQYIVTKAPDEIICNFIGEKFQPSCYGYGVEGRLLIISTTNPNCQDEDFFKTIMMHEFGHILNATHENRNHISNTHLGAHCTNNRCIMGESDYPRLSQERVERKRRGQPPFCDECIASMRSYLEKMPELTKEVQVQQFSEQLPVLPHNDNSWKKEFREFYQRTAQRDGDVYLEDRKSANYLARIKRADGSSLEIEANNEYHVALGAKTADGRDDVPSLKDMRDLVKLAQSKNSGMDFGKDNEPEFNARLMIACLELKPKPLDMRNQPEITPEFLSQIQPETRRQLQAVLKARQNGNGQNIAACNQNSR